MDKFYVYRPLLDLIGYTEGTDKGAGYNETLGFGIMLDGKLSKGKGKSVDLVGMTRKQVDALQTKMLSDPDNKKLKSSAVGRYQETRTTRREIDKVLGRTGTELFNEAGQDEDACYLLGVRGVDKYLAGRLSEDTLINNLAKEWASLPTTSDRGFYVGQKSAVSSAKVRAVLAEVKTRHLEKQPVTEVIEKPTVPKEVEKSVQHKFNWLTSIFGAGGVGAGFIAWLKDADWQTFAVIGGGGVAAVLLSLSIGVWAVSRIKAIRREWEAA